MRNSVVVESALELVFGYVSDMLNELECNRNVVSMIRLDQGPIRVGYWVIQASRWWMPAPKRTGRGRPSLRSSAAS